MLFIVCQRVEGPLLYIACLLEDYDLIDFLLEQH